MKEIGKIKTSIPYPEKTLLIAEVIKKNKEFVLAHPEYKLNLDEYLRLKYFFYLFHRGYSVAAIIGHKEFFGLDFLVNKQVLIPRPETEIMVEGVLKNINKNDTLIDVGTGSGCVLISILKNRPVQYAYGLDISCRALKIARQNARRHKINAKFLKSDLLKNFKNKKTGKNIFITANLPYLTQEQFKNSPTIKREPYRALVANNQGLELYEKLLRQVKDNITNKKINIFLEIDPSQAQLIQKTILKYFPHANIEIKKDLSGNDRLVIVSLRN